MAFEVHAEPESTATPEESGDYRRARLPRPSPDPVAYRDNLNRALASDPRRRSNYERFLHATLSAHVDHLPISLEVENVSRCNFHCAMCQVSDWAPAYQRADDMSLEEFKRLIDEQYGLVEINLQGMGEPLLGRDGYFEMIRYAHERHIWVKTVTNASLLHFHGNYKRLADSGVNEIQVSIDGATRKTFEKIRRGSRFDLVVANCRLLNSYCSQVGLSITRMNTVVQRDNVHEMVDLARLAHELGFKRSTFSLSVEDWGQETWSEINGLVSVDEAALGPAEEALEVGRRLGLEVTFWGTPRKFSTRSPETLCRWPFDQAYVASDMRIVPCSMISNPKTVDLGDARSFTKTWNGETYQEFRRAHLEGRPPRVCQRTCYDGSGS